MEMGLLVHNEDLADQVIFCKLTGLLPLKIATLVALVFLTKFSLDYHLHIRDFQLKCILYQDSSAKLCTRVILLYLTA